MQSKIILKGLGFRDQDSGKFYAVCLTTSHIASGKDFDEAINKVAAQVQTYIKSIHEHKGADLTLKDIRRRAPISFWNKYYYAYLLYHMIRLAHFTNDSFRFFTNSVDSKNAHLIPA